MSDHPMSSTGTTTTFGRASVPAAGVAPTASTATMTTIPTAVTSIVRRLHRERLIAMGPPAVILPFAFVPNATGLRGRVAQPNARLARYRDHPSLARGDPQPPSQPAGGAHRGADHHGPGRRFRPRNREVDHDRPLEHRSRGGDVRLRDPVLRRDDGRRSLRSG